MRSGGTSSADGSREDGPESIAAATSHNEHFRPLAFLDKRLNRRAETACRREPRWLCCAENNLADAGERLSGIPLGISFDFAVVEEDLLGLP